MNAGASSPPSGALEALWLELSPRLPGFTAEWVPEIDSTNSELMRRARSGLDAPVLLVAGRQSAGRGRVGRQWHGEPDDALMFSLGLPLAPADWSGLSLAVGLALADSLDPGVGLKWPNDLWWRSRKLGGILIEMASQGGRSQLIIGVGLNLAPPAHHDLRTPPAAVREFWPEARAGNVLERVIPALVSELLDFARTGFAPRLERYGRRDVLQGQAVTLSDGRTGTALGVSARGALRLQTDAGCVEVHSAEVSVRPAAAGPQESLS